MRPLLVVSSAAWRRLSLDIRHHNQTTLLYPYREPFGQGFFVGVGFAGYVAGLCFSPAHGFLVMTYCAMAAYYFRDPSLGAPRRVLAWRERHNISPICPIPELPEHIPKRLWPVRDDYDMLLQAAKNGALDDDE
jgi:hypothetical protein